jgi:hypothetical protein
MALRYEGSRSSGTAPSMCGKSWIAFCAPEDRALNPGRYLTWLLMDTGKLHNRCSDTIKLHFDQCHLSVFQ